MKITYKPKSIIIVLLIFVLFLGLAVSILLKLANGTETTARNDSLPTFSVDELHAFDGSDPEKPIYLALDGAVYDVTAGREYYQTDGSYHYLAGKDSSKELHLVGGNIIKEKYPIIGYLKSE